MCKKRERKNKDGFSILEDFVVGIISTSLLLVVIGLIIVLICITAMILGGKI